jgi:dihydrodipicolinate synthase/N-acetylneuraminate lyase
MKTSTQFPGDLRGVFAVPPLCRKNVATRSIDFKQNDLVVRHIVNGGIKRLLYGGNAFLYHATLVEFEQLLDWLSSLTGDLWAIPSVGPGYGRAMDQAALVRNYQFPCVMMLPCRDPREVAGMEQGYREIAEAAKAMLIVYLKDENNLGPKKEAGLDMVARLVEEGICAGIKYAVVRKDPSRDSYLDSLLQRVDRQYVISGIGERPAVTHLRDWKLPGFTTGSGCIGPRLSQMLFDECVRGDFAAAETLRVTFLPLEDLRDAWGPAKVLHSATESAGIAVTGPVPPFFSALTTEQLQTVLPVARALVEQDSHFRAESQSQQPARSSHFPDLSGSAV